MPSKMDKFKPFAIECLEYVIRMVILIPFHMLTVLVYTPFIWYVANRVEHKYLSLNPISFGETYGLLLFVSMGLGLVAQYAYMQEKAHHAQ